MRTFENRHFVVGRCAQIIPGLNALGKQGWEVVCREPDDIGGNYAYLLKREIPDDERIEVRSDIKVPPHLLTVVAANRDAPLPDADAAAAERTTKRLVPRDPPDTRLPWAERALGPREVMYEPATGKCIVDGKEFTEGDIDLYRRNGRPLQRAEQQADKVPATAH